MSEVAQIDPTQPVDALDQPDFANLTDEQLREAMRLQLVDVSHGVEANAIDSADNYIAEQTSQHGFKGFIKRIWHGNIARDFIRQRQIERGKQDIVDSGNLYETSGGTHAEHDQAMQSIVTRFTSEYDLLHKGETNGELDADEAGRQLQTDIKSLIGRYADGSIDAHELEEEKTRLLSGYGQQVHGGDRRKGLLFADNITAVAETARAAFQHNVALDRIDAALSGKVGEAFVGVRTEARRTMTDRAVDKLYATKAGALVNETTLSAAVATAMMAGKFTTQKAVTAATATVSLGVGAGVVAGVREHARVGQERQLHLRQMAAGGAIEDGSKKRQKFEATRYESVSAESLTERLAMSTETLLQDINGVNFEELVATIAETETRLRVSEAENADLVSFSDFHQVENERLSLDIALARAKVELANVLQQATPEQRANFGPDIDDLDQAVTDFSAALEETFRDDMSAKDRAFNKLRRNRTLTMAACGFASGVVIGTAIEEIKAAVSGELQGVLESNGSEQSRRTILASVFHHGGGHVYETTGDSGSAHHLVDVSDHARVHVPDGYELTKNDQGKWLLSGPDGKQLHVAFDKQGHFTEHTAESLKQAGYNLHDHLTHHPETTRHAVHKTMDSNEWLRTHRGDLTAVHRELWYDNNTTKFDLNELKLDWGGQGGVDQHGNYVFNVSHMLPDGSFHDGLSANAQHLVQNGHFKIALSFTEGTQSHVVMVPIDAHGNAIISKDSFAGQSLFSHHDGQTQFLGKYAEAVQVMGHNHDGSANVRTLATVVGQGQPQHGTVLVHQIEHRNVERVISTLNHPEVQQAAGPMRVEINPVLPLYGRRGLENLKLAESAAYYGYGEYSPDNLQHLRDERSPRLNDNPEAELNPGQEVDWYTARLATAEPEPGYSQTIHDYVRSSSELSGMDARTEAIVCIPVGAVGEADNIYNTLSLYAQQDQDAKERTTVLLHVNWIDDAMQDDAKRAKIEKTKAEIERARQAFPDLKIATMETEWERSRVEARGGVIGDVARRLFDTALVAVDNAKKNNGHAGDQEVLIIRNDADAKGMSRHYLQQMLTAADSREEDVFVGSVRWDTARHGDYPGYGLVTNFREVMHGVAHLGSSKSRVPTVGINTAIKASTLAAVGCIGHGEYVGAGSDDLEIGHRVYAARSQAYNATGPSSYGYGAADDTAAPGTRTLRRIAQRRRRVSYKAGQAGTQAGERRPVGLVSGANIDTNGDRLLNLYRVRRPITDAWGDFDRGGHKDRTVVDSPADLMGPESVHRRSFITQIERNVGDMGTKWFHDPAYMRAGLAFMFPEKDDQGRPIYSIVWKKGRCDFQFTATGRSWLTKRMLTDGRGRRDPYGQRIRRQLYNEVPRGSRRKPAAPQSRLVSPLA